MVPTQPKLIVTDLDMTLLRSDKNISDDTWHVLQACRNRGILFAIATARVRSAALSILDRLQPDYEIFAEGTLTYQNGVFLHGTPFSPEQTRALIKAILQYDSAANIVAALPDKALYCGDAPTWPAEAYDFNMPMDQPVYKIGCSISSCEAAERIALELGCQFKGYRGENWFSFLPAGAGKLPAVSRLAAHSGIALDDVWAFGDDLGDLDMLRGCGRGIAVANALPEVISAADAVTCSNEEDGPAVYLDRECLSAIG